MAVLLKLLISLGSVAIQALSTLDIVALKGWMYEPKAPKSLL